jgi:hypothetical protein
LKVAQYYEFYSKRVGAETEPFCVNQSGFLNTVFTGAVPKMKIEKKGEIISPAPGAGIVADRAAGEKLVKV